MDRKTRLDKGILSRLGFRLEGGKWYHVQDEGFSIRLTQTCFYVSFCGLESGFPYSPTVGKLEKLYLERTRKWLFSEFKRPSTER